MFVSALVEEAVSNEPADRNIIISINRKTRYSGPATRHHKKITREHPKKLGTPQIDCSGDPRP